MIVPAFPLIVDPEQWDALTLLAATIFLEAQGEPDDGQLAVGYVVMNRSTKWKQTVTVACLTPQQFSCWNADYRVRAGARLHTADVSTIPCWKAAAAALWGLLPDPTAGATHYLNVDATRKLRGGHLPSWAERMISAGPTLQISRHTFLYG